MRSFVHKRRRRSVRGLSPHNIGTAVAIVAPAACASYANLPGDTAGAAADGAGTFTGRVTRVVDGDITAAMIDSGTAQEFCRYSGNHYRTC